MSVSRQDLADALTEAGVAGTALPPSAPQPGQAWPVWRSSVPMAGGLEVTWDVFVVLSGGSPHAAAISEADPLIVTVTDHLLELGVVSIVSPIALAADAPGGQDLPALRITLTTL